MEPLEIVHKCEIRDVENLKYPLLVNCTCNFQAHCQTEAEADFRKRSHEHSSEWLKATKGWQYGK